jgi:hypothetical protein
VALDVIDVVSVAGSLAPDDREALFGPPRPAGIGLAEAA